MAALLVLRYKEPKLPRPYKVTVTKIIIITSSIVIMKYLSSARSSSRSLCWSSASTLSSHPSLTIHRSTNQPLYCLGDDFMTMVIICLFCAFVMIIIMMTILQIEYLYSILFMVFGAIIYLPFVHFGYVFKFMPKLTSFLQARSSSLFYNDDDNILTFVKSWHQ